jgi:hypothetical protein
MPSTIASTTPRELEAAIIATIMAIVPSEVSHRDAGWTPMEENRVEGSSSNVPRLFRVKTFPGGDVPAGITGNGDSETYLSLDVVVDYRVFEEDELGYIVAADQSDLYDAIEEQINIIPGLTNVTISSEPSIEGEEGELRIRYPLMLQYMRARRF